MEGTAAVGRQPTHGLFQPLHLTMPFCHPVIDPASRRSRDLVPPQHLHLRLPRAPLRRPLLCPPLRLDPCYRPSVRCSPRPPSDRLLPVQLSVITHHSPCSTPNTSTQTVATRPGVPSFDPCAFSSGTFKATLPTWPSLALFTSPHVPTGVGLGESGLEP